MLHTLKAIKEKAVELNNSQLHMFTDHVKVMINQSDSGDSELESGRALWWSEHKKYKIAKVIGDGAFFSQLMQMKEGYTDGHTGEWFTRWFFKWLLQCGFI